MLRYPLYQKTDLPWLAEIPAHWDLRRNKNVFSEMKEEVGERSGEYTLLQLSECRAAGDQLGRHVRTRREIPAPERQERSLWAGLQQQFQHRSRKLCQQH